MKNSHSPKAGKVFQAPFGSEVRAVFDGIVIFNDTVPGYGKVVIIDHGDDYYTLTGQGSRFFVKVGQKVTEGEIIGFVGSGAWSEQGIYFEIRHNGLPEDPTVWLDLRGFSH